MQNVVEFFYMFYREFCRTAGTKATQAVKPLITSLVQGYIIACKDKKPDERDLTEFFGLRDFYR